MARANIPYSCQSISDGDVQEVIDVLRSDWLTTGPALLSFEQALAQTGGARHAVAVSSGTAALHAAYSVAGVGPGTEVIVPSLTFCATANVAIHLGARVRFADISPETLTLDPNSVEEKLTPETRAIVPVDFAGHPAELDRLGAIAKSAGAVLIEDAAHSLGAHYRSRPVGSVADLTCFSFHPAKVITTGEGGAILTDNPEWAERLQRFRIHGMVRGSVVVGDSGPWVYDVGEPAYNYRLSDIHCALGCSQLERLGGFIERRRQIAARYRHLLEGHPEILLPPEREWCSHAYHLFPIRVPVAKRADLYHWLRSDGFGVQVHYVPVNAFSAYGRLGHRPEDTPVTLETYRGLLSIPCHQGMSDAEVTLVTDRLLSFFE